MSSVIQFPRTNARESAQHGADPFYDWVASMLECLQAGGEDALAQFLKSHPVSPDWAECAENLLRGFRGEKSGRILAQAIPHAIQAKGQSWLKAVDSASR